MQNDIAQRQNKYSEIENALQKLIRTEDKLGYLIAELTEQPTEQPKASTTVEVDSFIGVYNKLPAALNELNERLEMHTGMIRDLLI